MANGVRLLCLASAAAILLLGGCTETEYVQDPVTVAPTTSAPAAAEPAPVPTPSETADWYEQFAAETEQVNITISGKPYLCEVLEPDAVTPSGYYCWKKSRGSMEDIIRNESLYLNPDFYCPKDDQKPCNANPDQLSDPKGTKGPQPAPGVYQPPASSGGFNEAACAFAGQPLYGSVYVTTSPGLADLSVYVTSSPGLADLSVYDVGYSSGASSCGKWHYVSSPGLADFSIYETSSPGLADLTVYPVGYPSGAGT